MGKIIGIDDFGLSAPAPEVFAHFNLDADSIVQEFQKVLKV